MGLSDALNRRVRARPQEDEEIYSELSASDESGEEVSGSEEEEADGTDVSDAGLEDDEDDASQAEDDKVRIDHQFLLYGGVLTLRYSQTMTPVTKTKTKLKKAKKKKKKRTSNRP